jgi:hypothetical protein
MWHRLLALAIAVLGIANPCSSVILGWLDTVTNEGNKVLVQGWCCETGLGWSPFSFLNPSSVFLILIDFAIVSKRYCH